MSRAMQQMKTMISSGGPRKTPAEQRLGSPRTEKTSRRDFMHWATFVLGVGAAGILGASDFLAAAGIQPQCVSPICDDRLDAQLAEDRRREFVRRHDPDQLKVFDGSQDPSVTRDVFKKAVEKVRYKQLLGDLPKSGFRGPSFSWKATLSEFGKGLLPGFASKLADAYSVARKLGSGMMMQSGLVPPFDAEVNNRRALAFLAANQEFLTQYSPENARNFNADPPHVKARSVARAAIKFLDVQDWPTTWDVYAIYMATAGIKGANAPGTFAKEGLIGKFLGTNSEEYRLWDSATSIRWKGEAVRKAYTSLLSLIEQLVVDSPEIAIDDFKEQVNFKAQMTWISDPDDSKRMVYDAFGKSSAERYERLKGLPRPTAPEREEIDSLERGSTAILLLNGLIGQWVL